MEPPSSTSRDPQPIRRRLEATAQPLTTAEEQAQRHGISSDISNALQNYVPSRVRQAVNAGRNSGLGRTQSQPVFANSSSGFQTANQIIQNAESIIHKENWRRQKRELQPYGSAESSEMSALDLPGSNAAERERGSRRLKFGADGEVVMEGDEPVAGASGSRAKGKKVDWGLSQGKKRGAEADGGEEAGNVSDTATEVDEDEERPQLGNGTADEFPPVFTSPAISHPDLFRSNQFPSVPPSRKGVMGPPSTHTVAGGRQMRGLPGRALGKTVSAPVFGRAHEGMEVDGDGAGEDGFDVSEWAEQTDF